MVKILAGEIEQKDTNQINLWRFLAEELVKRLSFESGDEEIKGVESFSRGWIFGFDFCMRLLSLWL